MALFDEHPLSELDTKAHALLGEKVVIKALTQSSAFHGLPRYVSEYLIAKYVKPATWRDDLGKIQEKIRELLPNLEYREILKERLLSKGEVTLIDQVEVRVDLRGGQRWGNIQAISDNKVRVAGSLLEANPGLLLGGMWGTLKIRYSPEIDSDYPNELVSFTPFQVGVPNISEYREIRSKFTTQEWTELMLQSCGYHPGAVPEKRTRWLLLARLLPLVERNINLIELGPRQTGKTFLLRNISPRVFTMSGGKTTPANLFVNLATKQVGILGTRKVIVFDEIAHTVFSEDETISTLKDYMESGHFSRGSLAFQSDASLVFAGNLDVDDGLPDEKYLHLFEPLPKQLIDSAFMDRMHGYLPGWEIPKIHREMLANGIGFLTDYFGEVLARLREDHYSDRVRSIQLQPGATRRDTNAVERISSGMLKLIFPHGEVTDEELHEVVTFACELRQRVHQQLVALAPGEFKPRLIAPTGIEQFAGKDLSRSVTAATQDRLNTESVIGAVTGLAVISSDGKEIGGDTILIQVSCIRGTAGVEVTGIHGRVLKDSVRTAYNIVRARFREFGVSENRLQSQTVAVHLVRIAEPKEGPSAGLAFVVGIVSALTNRAIKAGFAFTGEVALHGEVTEVGGVRHKVLAAARAGRQHVVFPALNAKDLDSQDVSGIQLHPVNTVQEALAICLEP
ncbi:MAG: BREX system Lon protease-like protein BrxL [Zavarzinella sp.]